MLLDSTRTVAGSSTPLDTTPREKLHTWAKCPECGFEWERNISPALWTNIQTIHCPSCCKALKAIRAVYAYQPFFGSASIAFDRWV